MAGKVRQPVSTKPAVEQIDFSAALRYSIAKDLKQRDTPSRPDGYPVEVEVSCRISACFFIADAAVSIQPGVYVPLHNNSTAPVKILL
jgi:hypothetical protein